MGTEPIKYQPVDAGVAYDSSTMEVVKDENNNDIIVKKPIELVENKNNGDAGTDKFEFSKTNYGGKEKVVFEAMITTKDKKGLYDLIQGAGDSGNDVKETLIKYMRHNDKTISKNATDILKYVETQEAINGGNVKNNGKLNKEGRKQVKEDLRSDKSFAKAQTTEVVIGGSIEDGLTSTKADQKAAEAQNKDSEFKMNYERLSKGDLKAVKKLTGNVGDDNKVFIDEDGDGKLSSDEYKAGIHKFTEITNSKAGQKGYNENDNYLDWNDQSAASKQYDISQYRVRHLTGHAYDMKMSKTEAILLAVGGGIVLGAATGGILGSFLTIGATAAASATASATVNGVVLATSTATASSAVATTLLVPGTILGAGLGAAAGLTAGAVTAKSKKDAVQKQKPCPDPQPCPEPTYTIKDCDEAQAIINNLQSVASQLGLSQDTVDERIRAAKAWATLNNCDLTPTKPDIPDNPCIKTKFEESTPIGPCQVYHVKSGEYWWGIITNQYGTCNWKMVEELANQYGISLKQVRAGMVPPRTLNLPATLGGHDCKQSDKRSISDRNGKTIKFTGTYTNPITQETRTVYGYTDCNNQRFEFKTQKDRDDALNK